MQAPNPPASFWRGDRIRLRAMAIADAAHWLAFDEDSEAIRTLNMGLSLPRSPTQAADSRAPKSR